MPLDINDHPYRSRNVNFYKEIHLNAWPRCITIISSERYCLIFSDFFSSFIVMKLCETLICNLHYLQRCKTDRDTIYITNYLHCAWKEHTKETFVSFLLPWFHDYLVVINGPNPEPKEANKGG